MYVKVFRINIKLLLAGAGLFVFVLFSLVLLLWGRGEEIAVSGPGKVPLPVIMYHHTLKEQTKLGDYIISPDEFEKDLIYLKQKGYTTVTINDIIGFVTDNKPLPAKPVMLTFDDAFLSTYVYIYPLLNQYDAKIVLSVVGSYSEIYSNSNDTNLSYAYMTWDQIKEVSDSGRCEIQNHSFDMHKDTGREGTTIKKDESLEDYKRALWEDIDRNQNLIEEHTGRRPTAFTYPYGFISPESLPILKEMGFLSTLSCTEGINQLTGSPDELYRLKRYNRRHGHDIEAFLLSGK